MFALLIWVLTKSRRCPWGCGEWVHDENIARHWNWEHAGDSPIARG